MSRAVIVGAARTAIGAFGGALKGTPVAELGRAAIQAALGRSGAEADAVEEVIMGNVLQAGAGMNPARQAAIAAGLPESIPSFTINKVCGSGLKAVALAAQAIAAGDAELIIAGGMESMSRAPYLLPDARWGARLGNAPLVDSMLSEGLTCAMAHCHMGLTAENIAARYGVTREEQDAFAAESQARAAAAISSGRFKHEIVPVMIPQRKGSAVAFEVDEHPRAGTTAGSLAKLTPAFQKESGTVTAGNASGINDGA